MVKSILVHGLSIVSTQGNKQMASPLHLCLKMEVISGHHHLLQWLGFTMYNFQNLSLLINAFERWKMFWKAKCTHGNNNGHLHNLQSREKTKKEEKKPPRIKILE